MAKKFKVEPFKEWLDVLAKVVVKTRDGFTCQIVHDPACSGTMIPLDKNCQWCHIKSRKSNKTRWDLLNTLTGCGHCHAWAHANPNEFGVWFAAKYPHRDGWINAVQKQPNKTWRQKDFEQIERFLLQKSIDLNVDYLHVNTKYRDRFKRRTEEMRMEL
jgi:hypothetical protein